MFSNLFPSNAERMTAAFFFAIQTPGTIDRIEQALVDAFNEYLNDEQTWTDEELTSTCKSYFRRAVYAIINEVAGDQMKSLRAAGNIPSELIDRAWEHAKKSERFNSFVAECAA